MTSHYKFYEHSNEIVPWNAAYDFPNQARRTWKQTVRLSPMGGNEFTSGSNQHIQINLPAQGYLNPNNSFLTYDLEVVGASASKNLRFQNYAGSVLKRGRISYGSTLPEDIPELGILSRMLIEATGGNTNAGIDQTSVDQGIGGISTKSTYTTPGHGVSATVAINSTMTVNTRLDKIQGFGHDYDTDAQGTVHNAIEGLYPRRYAIQTPMGMNVQSKLWPLKWMASSLQIYYELANTCQEVMCATVWEAGLTFKLSNVAFVAEILDFDTSYDEFFLNGMRSKGVPIKYSTWDYTRITPTASTTQTIRIPNNNRSIKAAFVVQTPPDGPALYNTLAAATPSGLPIDSHAFLQSSNGWSTANGYGSGHLVQFQWKLGGKMYPSQPVMCGNTSTGLSNGACEAYEEFAKALNIIGDSRLSTGISSARWNRLVGNVGLSSAIDWSGGLDSAATTANTNLHHGDGPSFFVIACSFETSDGTEVSGINGEEQNDIQLNITYSAAQSVNCNYHCFIYYDAMMVLNANNRVQIIK